MGADIHMFIEWRHRDGEWQADENHKIIEEFGPDDAYVQQVNAVGRNYNVFAALAGVRGSGPEPKGLPPDVSEIVKKGIPEKNYDYHSHSYYSLEEFTRIIQGCGYDLSEDTRPIAFYKWKDYNWTGSEGKPKTPEDYICLIHYCRELKNTKYVDNIILGDDDGRQDIEVRLVFAFDN